MSIDDFKNSTSDPIRFILKDATVYGRKSGYTYSKYFDDPEIKQPELNKVARAKLHEYLETQLQVNKRRAINQVALLKKYVKKGSRILDVGCGGGAFLRLARENGYDVKGLEVEPNRARYCRDKVGLDIEEVDIMNKNFQKQYAKYFDCITLWDVIEHVNYPTATLKSVRNCLRSDGYVMIDTPAKDAFYHWFGEKSYDFTRGKFPTFLNIMYSEQPFGHKQIFSSGELKKELMTAGFEVSSLTKIHELTFPITFYLERLLKIKVFIWVLSPLVSFSFKFLRIKNKLITVAKK